MFNVMQFLNNTMKRRGMPYIENGMLHTPLWFPEPGARCIEPGCKAEPPEADGIGLCQCGDLTHPVSHGKRILSKIDELKRINPRNWRPDQIIERELRRYRALAASGWQKPGESGAEYRARWLAAGEDPLKPDPPDYYDD